MSGHRLSSFYPQNIPIGQVTKVGQTDVDPFQDVQVMPFVDFSSLQFVLVLASESRDRRCRDRPRIAKAAVLFFVVAIVQVTIVSVDRDPRRLARPRARHARRRRAHAGLDLRCRQRLLGRPAARRRAARHARLHVAPAHPRRLLDRPLRRDDRTRSRARAAALGRGRDGAVRDRLARHALPAPRVRRRHGSFWSRNCPARSR